MSGHALASSLIADAASFGLSLSADRWEQVARYRDLLLEWNDRFNLTAITEPAGVERRLILDALRMLPILDARVAAMTSKAAVRLVDVGTGAGFPGLALKIARPELDVTLVEATGKKVRFLEHVMVTLGLSGTRAIHARAEDLGHDPSHRAQYDIATARAVASLPALLELCAPLLHPGGLTLFPKSVELDEELEAGRRAAPLVGMTVEPSVILPDSSTRLVTAIKTGVTPSRFPRRAGIPAREPLGGAVPARRKASRGGTTP
ncbi:MAG TPA: 16S rRNA (guanine(527)-N(7))-methyltransferase RsmG [Thermomicrobiales bacterium]|nr:16S rRNA (guanine(527)-N(7))-methyltransferase RsmG [Thermomicrobiales bacterium]